MRVVSSSSSSINNNNNNNNNNKENKSNMMFPPGFRFHPTDEELVLYYLKRKICRRPLKLDIIAETDVYKWDPHELPGFSKLKTGDRQWFFFSPRDRKYPNGGRSNRATMQGYWKATGKDRVISCNSRAVGSKKTLVYYKGRAPSGERTDWVMHEYTLDEEELKRCVSAKDYYALYKIFKKSGLGPKNGEQYGAPFVEEDWADDGCVNFNNDDQVNNVKKTDVSCVANNRSNAQLQCPVNDLEHILNQIADEPLLASPVVDFGYTLDQIFGVEESTGTLVNQSSSEISIPDGNMVVHQSQHCYEEPSFDYTQFASSQLQFSEVTTVTKISGLNMCENYREDFLEMDDLIGPEPTVQNVSQKPEPVPVHEFDGLRHLDLYDDTNMFLYDMVPGEQGQLSRPYMNNFDTSKFYMNYIENGAVSQQEPYGNADASLMNSQLWADNERSSFYDSAEANQTAVSDPISGVGCNDSPATVSTGAVQNRSSKNSWLSSTLWAFVDSIPTTPASASEFPLVNRAFERVSSFGRLKVETAKTNCVAGNPGATSKTCGSFKLGFFCFAIFGMILAILWVLIGTSFKSLGEYLAS